MMKRKNIRKTVVTALMTAFLTGASAFSLTACGDTSITDNKQASAKTEKREEKSSEEEKSGNKGSKEQKQNAASDESQSQSTQSSGSKEQDNKNSKENNQEIKNNEEQNQDTGSTKVQSQDTGSTQSQLQADKDNGAKNDDRISPFVGVKYYLSSDIGFEVVNADTDGVKTLNVWGLENGVSAKYEYDLTPHGFQNWLGKVVLGCKDDDFEVTFYFDQKAKFCEVIVKGPVDASGAAHKGLGFLQSEKYVTDMPGTTEPSVTKKENQWEIETMEPTKMIVSGSPAVKTAPSLDADKVKVSFAAGSEVIVIGHVSEYNGSKCDYYLIQGDVEMYVQGFFLKKAENSGDSDNQR